MIGASLAMVTLMVPDMEDAIAHFVGSWGFLLHRDGYHDSGHRWVELALDGGARIRLAEAADDAQRSVIGQQAGGRVAFFLEVTDFDVMVERWTAKGIAISEPARCESYGRIIVLCDKYGNRWDVIQPSEAVPA